MDKYLAELMRNEGRGDSTVDLCYHCEAGIPLYCCMDCFAEDLVCEECCKELHRDCPLDIIEV